MADNVNRGSNTGQQPRHATQGGRQEESSGSTMGNVLETAQNVASNVGQAASQAWDTTRQAAGQAWDTTRQYAQQAGSTVADYAETAWDSSRSFLRRYPFATLAMGFGLGFLVCMAMQSNRS